MKTKLLLVTACFFLLSCSSNTQKFDDYTLHLSDDGKVESVTSKLLINPVVVAQNNNWVVVQSDFKTVANYSPKVVSDREYYSLSKTDGSLHCLGSGIKPDDNYIRQNLFLIFHEDRANGNKIILARLDGKILFENRGYQTFSPVEDFDGNLERIELTKENTFYKTTITYDVKAHHIHTAETRKGPY